MPDDTALDPVAITELLEAVGGDLEFMADLIATYVGDSPALIAGMRGGLSSGDATGVRRAAHTLKSTSATFGATRLVAMSREIEAAAAAENLAGLEPQIEAAAAEYEVVAAALRAAVESGLGAAS